MKIHEKIEEYINVTLGKLTRLIYRITVLPFRIRPILQTVPEEISKLAAKSSAEYAYSNMQKALIFEKMTEFWDYSLSKIGDASDMCLEFGVWKGDSIRYFAGKLPTFQFTGFDSFEGLQEDWPGSRQPKGFFHLHGELPSVPRNVTLIKGWFEDSLPGFLNLELNSASIFPLIHMDADTYTPTKFVLNSLNSHIGIGTVIIFDEYFGLPFWEENEHKAFMEFVTDNNRIFRYIALSNLAVAVQILN